MKSAHERSRQQIIQVGFDETLLREIEKYREQLATRGDGLRVPLQPRNAVIRDLLWRGLESISKESGA